MQINVNFEEVRQAGGALANNAASYQEVVDRIYARLSQISSIWQGADSQAFLGQLESLRPSLVQMREVVDSYAQVLKFSADSYMNLQNNRAASARML